MDHLSNRSPALLCRPEHQNSRRAVWSSSVVSRRILRLLLLKVDAVVKNRSAMALNFDSFGSMPSHFHTRSPREDPGEGGVAAFADRGCDFLFRATATDADSYRLIWQQFRDESIKFANTRDALTVDAQDDVVLAQAGCRLDCL